MSCSLERGEILFVEDCFISGGPDFPANKFGYGDSNLLPKTLVGNAGGIKRIPVLEELNYRIECWLGINEFEEENLPDKFSEKAIQE